MTPAKPCPFCGGVKTAFVEGSTFRWLKIECMECGACSGESRRRTLPPLDEQADKEDALSVWNERTP